MLFIIFFFGEKVFKIDVNNERMARKIIVREGDYESTR